MHCIKGGRAAVMKVEEFRDMVIQLFSDGGGDAGGVQYGTDVSVHPRPIIYHHIVSWIALCFCFTTLLCLRTILYCFDSIRARCFIMIDGYTSRFLLASVLSFPNPKNDNHINPREVQYIYGIC